MKATEFGNYTKPMATDDCFIVCDACGEASHISEWEKAHTPGTHPVYEPWGDQCPLCEWVHPFGLGPLETYTTG